MSFRKYVIVALFLLSFGFAVQAQDLEIIPQVQGNGVETVAQDVNSVAVGGKVWDNYNNTLTKNRDLSQKLASGIMDRNTILEYFARFVKYLSQLGIFVGACFVVYAGYVYATAVFQDGKVSQGNTAIQNAILGVIIITFSYAIMKAIMAAFL